MCSCFCTQLVQQMLALPLDGWRLTIQRLTAELLIVKVLSALEGDLTQDVTREASSNCWYEVKDGASMAAGQLSVGLVLAEMLHPQSSNKWICRKIRFSGLYSKALSHSVDGSVSCCTVDASSGRATADACSGRSRVP